MPKKDKKDKKKKKQSYSYFDSFVRLTEYSCSAANVLDGVLRDFDVAGLPKKLEEIHAIEHEADGAKHDIVKALVKEFITPIEREDIAEMTQLLDDVTDAIEDVLVKIYTFNITKMKPEAVQFSDIILKCCATLKQAMEQFSGFKKSSLLKEHIIEINRLEGEGDMLYSTAMRDLHVTSKDPIEIMTWSRLFDRFETCCDSFEEAADFAEYIIMKNS